MALEYKIWWLRAGYAEYESGPAHYEETSPLHTMGDDGSSSASEPSKYGFQVQCSGILMKEIP